MTAATEPERVSRGCDKCSVVDSDPRHTVFFAVADPRTPGAFVDLTDIHHFDCGATAGCEHCVEVMTASENAHGDALITHLTAPSTEA